MIVTSVIQTTKRRKNLFFCIYKEEILHFVLNNRQTCSSWSNGFILLKWWELPIAENKRKWRISTYILVRYSYQNRKFMVNIKLKWLFIDKKYIFRLDLSEIILTFVVRYYHYSSLRSMRKESNLWLKRATGISNYVRGVLPIYGLAPVWNIQCISLHSFPRGTWWYNATGQQDRSLSCYNLTLPSWVIHQLL